MGQGPIDLGQALSELSWRFTPRFAAADRELSVEVEEGNGVSADRMRLEQAIGNLLAIVDAIARAHGGSAHAGHRAGGGADVWLVLPLDRGRLEPLAV